MLTRRRILLGLGAAALAPHGAGCTRTRAARPPWPRTTTHDGVEMIELFPQDADESSPLIVAIHGMGDRPDRWVADWREFPARVHIALPRAFDAYGGGFSWFRFEDGMTDEEFGAVVGSAEERLWRGIAKLAGKRRVIVTGFSQGGILSFAIAARHPAEVVHAFPVAGSCPGPVLPKDKARAAPLLAFHGTADRVLDVKWGREAVNAFKEQGNVAEIREYEGIGHTIAPRMHDDLWDAIKKALPPATP
ncbi:MAG: dienelactone hydrolase family protein [Labilithrix sp.]|nr:dienelactone hydrolase family protein [Labilithrix sp.]